MNTTYIQAQQNDLLQAVPALRKPISERRPPAEGMLAEEAFIARSSLASRQPEAALIVFKNSLSALHGAPSV